MDQEIANYVSLHFKDVKLFKTTRGTHYIVGNIYEDNYIISKQHNFIVTKKVDDEQRYVGCYDLVEDVCKLLESIKNKETLVANEQARRLAAITGFNTI